MTQRLLVIAAIFAVGMLAQQRVDPKYMYYRAICVVPYIGQGTQADPIRPKYVPAAGVDPKGILAYTQVASDDGKVAIVEFVTKDSAALEVILNDHQVKSFVKGKHSKNEIETEIRKYKHDFDLAQFGVVLP